MASRSLSTHPRTLRLFRLVAAGIVGMVALGACKASVSLGSNEIAKADVESKVATQLAAQVNSTSPSSTIPTPRVTCPANLKGQVGASMDCDLVAQGETTHYPVHVVVDSVNGKDVHFTAQVGTTPVGSTSTT